MKLILPKKLIANPAKMARALTNALNGVAKDIQIDLKVTTQTWRHRVEFPIASPSPYRRTISTADEIYGYVNDGTRPHIIRPKGWRCARVPHTVHVQDVTEPDYEPSRQHRRERSAHEGGQPSRHDGA